MNIVEQNDNQYTKERTEVEAYLTRIIQRFFDIENNNTKESIEAIIVESLTRLKRDFYHLKTLIFHLNGKTGHIQVDIRDFNGEEAFEKKTAFNKDFGSDADTICEGNDPRLSNFRTPTYHVHTIADIDLFSLLPTSVAALQSAHSHENLNALDVITYTGTSTEIDLAVLEHVLERVEQYEEIIRRDGLSVQTAKIVNFKPLTDLLDRVQDSLNEAISLLSSVDSWLNDAKSHVDAKALQLSNYLSNLLLESELPKYQAAHDSVFLLGQDCIDLNDMNTFNNAQYKYHASGQETKVDCNISLNKQLTIPDGYKIAYVKAYIEFEKLESFIGVNADGVIANMTQYTRRSAPLPMYYPNVREKEPFLISFDYTEQGSLNFSVNFLVKIPSHCVEVCKLGNTMVFCTDGLSVQDELEKCLRCVVTYLNVCKLSPQDKTTLFNAMDSLPSREWQYLIDGRYQYTFDEDANITGQDWIDSNGDKIENIDWDSSFDNSERIGAYLVLMDNNKIASIYANITGVERSALFAINPSALNRYIKNPKIRYQVYCRKE